MAEWLVEQIVKGRLDYAGAEILAVYGKVDQTYAVYRTSERVVVQYADDDRLGSEQRRQLSPLNPIRGEINGYIDGWRNDARRLGKVAALDRRVADAMVMALQGDQANAAIVLAGIRNDIIAERTSTARTDYLLAAGATALVIILFAAGASVLSGWANLPDDVKSCWGASGFGALGALFSVALAIRDRPVWTDLQRWDNRVDGILRIVIGAISAAVLVCILRAKFASLKLGGVDLTGSGLCADIVIAFVAGFSERLVGNLLGSAALAAARNATNVGPAGAPSITTAPPAGANELNPRGNPDMAGAGNAQGSAAQQAGQSAAGSSGQDAIDGCVADTSLGADEHTADLELPPATGGVAEPRSGA